MLSNRLKNVAIYIRVSTEHQAKEGYSVAAQRKNLSNFVVNQGWNIFDVYADEGISGKNIQDRPEVKRLIDDIRNNKVDVVVLYKFDRLTRNARDTEDIINLIQEYGIEVLTLSGGVVDVSSAAGRFTVRVNGAVAQLEREQTIERVKVAFKQKVEEGYTLASSTACYGYDRKNHEKEMTINKKEAIVVKRIFKMYASGKTFTEICDILNAEKIPTKKNGWKLRKKGTTDYYVINSVWMPKTIRTILTNKTYIGYVRYHIGKKDGFEIIGRHEPIISQEIWDEVQERISKIKRVTKTNYPKDDVYYCGMLVCGICGHKFTTSRTVRNKSDGSKATFNGYRCINREKNLCTCLGVSHKKVESAFMSFMDNISELTEIENTKIDCNDGVDKEIKILKKKLTQINVKRSQIMNLFMVDKITLEQLQYMIQKLENSKSVLESKITSYKRKSKLNNVFDKKLIARTVKEHWEYLSNKERLEFLTNFVKKIVIINKDKDRHSGKPEILSVEFYDR